MAKAGSSTWSVAHPSNQASATVSAPNSTLPRVEAAKIHGSRRIATARTPNPSRRELRPESAETLSGLVDGALTVRGTLGGPEGFRPPD